MLWPDGPPPGAAAAPIEGRFRVSQAVPGGLPTVFLGMNTPEWSVDWTSGDPAGETCPGYYTPRIVRGDAGCSNDEPNGQLRIEWTERGRNMAVDAWGLDEGTLLSWLADWQDLPGS